MWRWTARTASGRQVCHPSRRSCSRSLSWPAESLSHSLRGTESYRVCVLIEAVSFEIFRKCIEWRCWLVCRSDLYKDLPKVSFIPCSICVRLSVFCREGTQLENLPQVGNSQTQVTQLVLLRVRLVLYSGSNSRSLLCASCLGRSVVPSTASSRMWGAARGCGAVLGHMQVLEKTFQTSIFVADHLIVVCVSLVVGK